MLSTRGRAALRGKPHASNVHPARSVIEGMITALRLPIVLGVTILATACSVERTNSSVQMPGETPWTAGLQVPPDAWAHPTQTASVAAAPGR